MGKKRVIEKSEEVKGAKTGEAKPREVKLAQRVGRAAQDGRASPNRVGRGIANIQATYNNTLINITDEKGNVLAWSSAGSLGFSGAKKATPFVAARVAQTVVEKSAKFGLQGVAVRVSGVGSGRDSAIRALANHGLEVSSIKDVTPLPHNGPRPKKARRV